MASIYVGYITVMVLWRPYMWDILRLWYYGVHICGIFYGYGIMASICVGYFTVIVLWRPYMWNILRLWYYGVHICWIIYGYGIMASISGGANRSSVVERPLESTPQSGPIELFLVLASVEQLV